MFPVSLVLKLLINLKHDYYIPTKLHVFIILLFKLIRLIIVHGMKGDEPMPTETFITTTKCISYRKCSSNSVVQSEVENMF